MFRKIKNHNKAKKKPSLMLKNYFPLCVVNLFDIELYSYTVKITTPLINSVAVGEQLNIIVFYSYTGKCWISSDLVC